MKRLLSCQGIFPVRPAVQHPDEVHRGSDPDAESEGRLLLPGSMVLTVLTVPVVPSGHQLTVRPPSRLKWPS